MPSERHRETIETMRTMVQLIVAAALLAACDRDNGLHRLGECADGWGSALAESGQCERACQQKPFSGGIRPDGGMRISCKATNPVHPLSSEGDGGEQCNDAFSTDDIYGDGRHIGCCVQAQNTGTAPPTIRFFECCQSSGFGDGTPYACPE